MLRQISILGPGLLGASISLAARERGLADRVVAWSRRPETRAKCLANGVCDEVRDNPSEAVRGSDCVILCTPVETIVPLLEEIQPSLSQNTLLTDVGSTKSYICRTAQGITIENCVFVGSHPMAGSDRCGMDHARADLFDGASCFLTPLDNAPSETVQKLAKFWQALGMSVEITSPERHDEIVANISHLPHALAAVLAKYLADRNPEWANFAGGGLRDTSRVAAGDPGLWKQIFNQNREEVIRAIEGFETDLHQFKAALLNDEPTKIQHYLQKGKIFRDSLDS